jgi:hypothetical protein
VERNSVCLAGKIAAEKGTRNKDVLSQFSLSESEAEVEFMKRDELLMNQENMWQALSGEQPMTLMLAVEMLQRCHLSPYQILTKTMTALEGLQQDS